MRVSVIVPVYNVFGYLAECVESILSQTYHDLEVILVDDGSTDGSGVLCDELAATDGRIITYHKSNGGLASARNYGLDRCSGDYVLFIDSDDYWNRTDVIELFVRASHSGKIDVVRGEFLPVDMFGNTIDKLLKEYPEKAPYKNKKFGSKEMMSTIIDGEYFTWLFFIRRSVAQRVRFNEEQRFQEDIDFALRLLVEPLKCSYISDRFYSYRNRPNSIITTPRISNLAGSFALSDTFERYAAAAASNGLERLYHTNSIMMYFWTLSTLASDTYYGNRKEIIKELSLCSLQNRVRSTLIHNRLLNKYILVFLVPPSIGSWLIHMKNRIMSLFFK